MIIVSFMLLSGNLLLPRGGGGVYSSLVQLENDILIGLQSFLKDELCESLIEFDRFKIC